MPVRGRSRSLQYVAGPDAILPGFGNSAIYLGYKGFTGIESCNDTTMPRPYNADHALRVLKSVWQAPLSLGGSFKYWNTGLPVVDVSMNGHIPKEAANPSYLPTPPDPAWGYWQTKAIANMSPLRADTGIPLFLFEFKDFPEMLRHAGRVLARRARASDYPGTYLAFHFGWAPLVADLRTLFDLAKKLDDRSRYLRNLEKGSRIRRTLRSGLADSNSSQFALYSLPAWPEQWVYQAEVKTETYVKVWYTANAKLAPGVTLPRSSGALRALTARQSLGLSLNPAAVWDFLPWSWLIDYFANVGDFMQANVGQTYVQCTRMNIMHRTEVVVSHSSVKTVSGVTFTPVIGKVTDKRRLPVSNPIPWLSFRPFLGAGQVFALENLVTARAFDAAAKRTSHSYS
jgi:hypothetical protein